MPERFLRVATAHHTDNGIEVAHYTLDTYDSNGCPPQPGALYIYLRCEETGAAVPIHAGCLVNLGNFLIEAMSAFPQVRLDNTLRLEMDQDDL